MLIKKLESKINAKIWFMRFWWCIYCCKRNYYCCKKKKFSAYDFEALNITADNANPTNTGHDNTFGEKQLVFKKNAPFINCISKINGVKFDNAEDLDVVMPMYNLVEYSKN